MLSRFDERVSYLTSIFDTFQSLSIFARLMYFNLDFRLRFSIVLWPLITIGIGEVVVKSPSIRHIRYDGYPPVFSYEIKHYYLLMYY